MFKKRVAYAGASLIGVGVLLIAVQMRVEGNDPFLFDRMVVVGFGVLLVGVLLWIVASFGRTLAKRK